MKTISLKEVNSAISALVDAKSDRQLYSHIAETAKTLIGADYVKLYLSDKDRLKRVYFSDLVIKPNNFISNKNFNNIVSNNKIHYFANKDIQKMRLSQFPQDIKTIMVVPLFHSQQLLGYIFLYFLNDRQNLNQIENELYILYSHMVVLTINKIKLQQESQKALEIRDRFISLASHELRTPLTAIHGYVQLLYKRMANKNTIESRWTKELYIESIRLTTLVKELLDVNRIKQGQFAFVFSEVSLQEVINQALERYRLTSNDHLFVFQCKLSDHQTKVVGDFAKLVDMVSGLLGNAVKFSKPGEKIIITLNHTVGMLSFDVIDTGRGIPRKDLIAIQNGFYKPEYANSMEGMGVGIMLARHIVENHRGKLKIKSKKNVGTTVTVSLPTIKSFK